MINTMRRIPSNASADGRSAIIEPAAPAEQEEQKQNNQNQAHWTTPPDVYGAYPVEPRRGNKVSSFLYIFGFS